MVFLGSFLFLKQWSRTYFLRVGLGLASNSLYKPRGLQLQLVSRPFRTSCWSCCSRPFRIAGSTFMFLNLLSISALLLLLMSGILRIGKGQASLSFLRGWIFPHACEVRKESMHACMIERKKQNIRNKSPIKALSVVTPYPSSGRYSWSQALCSHGRRKNSYKYLPYFTHFVYHFDHVSNAVYKYLPYFTHILYHFDHVRNAVHARVTSMRVSRLWLGEPRLSEGHLGSFP